MNEETHLLTEAAKLYGLDARAITPIPGHEGGRNATYRCLDSGVTRILRVSSLPDRSFEDYLAELAFVRYLKENGAPVAGVLPSKVGALAEQVEIGGKPRVVCLFENAPGDQIADHGYRYRPGAPLTEYFFNCGKTLGKLHALAKRYRPVHRRFDFFERYNEQYFDELLPDGFEALKETLHALLCRLRALPRDEDTYGLVHFDFSDGNYMIDYQTGDITVFDFDNCRYGPYLFDLANLWTHGVGWTQFEKDADKRRAYMDAYFAEVLAGYRSETDISDETLAHLPLLIDAVLMENIIDEFEVQKAAGEPLACDEEQAYDVHCLTRGIPYHGFFDAIYSPDAPFELPSD